MNQYVGIQDPGTDRCHQHHEGGCETETCGCFQRIGNPEEGAQPKEVSQNKVVDEQRANEDPEEIVHQLPPLSAAATSSRNSSFLNLNQLKNSRMTPSVRKPPGGNIMMTQGSKFSPKSFIPNSAPSPRISRTAPSENSASMNPPAMPSASITARRVGYRDANASCRPSIRQLATISGMNAPSSLCTFGTTARSV